MRSFSDPVNNATTQPGPLATIYNKAVQSEETSHLMIPLVSVNNLPTERIVNPRSPINYIGNLYALFRGASNTEVANNLGTKSQALADLPYEKGGGFTTVTFVEMGMNRKSAKSGI